MFHAVGVTIPYVLNPIVPIFNSGKELGLLLLLITVTTITKWFNFITCEHLRKNGK